VSKSFGKKKENQSLKKKNKQTNPPCCIHSFTYSSIGSFIRSLIHPSVHFIYRFVVGKLNADEAMDEHRRLNAETFIDILRSSMKFNRRFHPTNTGMRRTFPWNGIFRGTWGALRD
jgi:hypothetical protein